jgi:hypothetical protein
MWYQHYGLSNEALSQLQRSIATLQSQLELLRAELTDAERRKSNNNHAPFNDYLADDWFS